MFQVSGKFFVCAIQTLNKLRRGALFLLIRRMKIGMVLLDQPPPGQAHRVEASAVGQLKVSIIASKDRIQGLAGTCVRASRPRLAACARLVLRGRRAGLATDGRGIPRPTVGSDHMALSQLAPKPVGDAGTDRHGATSSRLGVGFMLAIGTRRNDDQSVVGADESIGGRVGHDLVASVPLDGEDDHPVAALHLGEQLQKRMPRE